MVNKITSPVTPIDEVNKINEIIDNLGGSASWGNITGTLSNQTDLNTALSAKANDSDVVKLTGVQSINGDKTFNANLFTKNLYARGNITLGTSTNTWGHMLQFQDTASKRIARVQPMAVDTTKNRIGMWVNNADNTVEKGIYIESNGNTYAPTPTEDTTNSTQIDTVGARNTKLANYVPTSSLATCHVVVDTYQNGTSWYRVYDDGWVEQGGRTTLNEVSTATITYLKAFSDTNYCLLAIQTTQSTAGDTEVGIQFTPTSATQGTLSCHYINPDTTDVSWYACGKGA